mmetsp:Transcript_85363/g.267065  ORF Transcript_85363/g.267065 Transcript_85363/m.267065 type:complete len:229 (-) Transcript_85363:277-963(-)
MLASKTKILRPVISRSQWKSCLVSSTCVWGSMPSVLLPVPIALMIFALIACALASSCFAWSSEACLFGTRDFGIGTSSTSCGQSSCSRWSLPRKRSHRSLLKGAMEQDSFRALSMSTVWSSRRYRSILLGSGLARGCFPPPGVGFFTGVGAFGLAAASTSTAWFGVSSLVPLWHFTRVISTNRSSRRDRVSLSSSCAFHASSCGRTSSCGGCRSSRSMKVFSLLHRSS